MNISISGLHLETDPELRKYAYKKAQKLGRYDSSITKIEVRLIFEKAHRGKDNDFYCEIKVVLPGHVLEIVDVEREFDKAIDKAIERMKRALVKNKEKHISQKRKKGVLRKLLSRIHH